MELIFEITLLVFALGSAIATFVGAQKNSPTRQRRTDK